MGLLGLPWLVLRYCVFVSLGCFVMFGVTHCVPEQSDINPPQNVRKYH